MYGYEEETRERKVSRSDKILEAKSAFGQDGRRAYAGCSRGSRQAASYSEKNGEPPYGEERHSFGMLRMFMAAALFFLLVSAFHFQVSYHGFNKESVKKALANESHWNSLVEQVTQVMGTLKK